jgi:mitochondrial fission protein ELM1
LFCEFMTSAQSVAYAHQVGQVLSTVDIRSQEVSKIPSRILKIYTVGTGKTKFETEVKYVKKCYINVTPHLK